MSKLLLPINFFLSFIVYTYLFNNDYDHITFFMKNLLDSDISRVHILRKYRTIDFAKKTESKINYLAVAKHITDGTAALTWNKITIVSKKYWAVNL